MVEKFERKQMPKPKVKGRIHLDEVEVKVGKNVLEHERGGQPDEVQSGLQIRREQEA